MTEEIAWYIGACLLSFCIGYGAGAWQRMFQQVLESST